MLLKSKTLDKIKGIGPKNKCCYKKWDFTTHMT